MTRSKDTRRAWVAIAAITSVFSLVEVSQSSSATAAVEAMSCQPSIQDLGDPLGGHFSFGDGVNVSGVVAGSAFLPSGRGRAVVWDHGQTTNLGVVAPYDESFAHDIGDDGTVVGELNFKGRNAAPFIYSDGQMRVLPGLGGDFGYASAINTRGVIVGTSSDAAGFPHAVVWTGGGRVVHDLGIAAGDEASFGSGISDANVVAGDSDAADESERPAIFVHGDVVILAGRSGPLGAAEDVNVAGLVVGTLFLPNGEQHATSWGRFRRHAHDLATLAGGDRASLIDVDNRGRAVGGGNYGVNPDQNHAVFWPATGPLLALKPLSGHFVRDFGLARNMGSEGQAVGGSQNAAGEVRATVWTCAAQQAFEPAGAARGTSSSARVITLPPGVARSVDH